MSRLDFYVIPEFIDLWSFAEEDPKTYTTRCNGVVSYGAQFGGLRVFFADYTCKSKRKASLFTIFARRTAFLRLFVFTFRLRYMQVAYEPDEPRLFWLHEKPKTPKFNNILREQNNVNMSVSFPFLFFSPCRLLFT